MRSELDVILRPELAAVLATALIAGFVRGMAGFGAGLVLTPVFSALYTPALAVPSLGLADFTMNMRNTLGAMRRCDWREVGPLAAAAVLALPFGGYLLATVRPDFLRVGMSLFILSAIGLLASGWRYRRKPGLTMTAAVGIVAGLAGGAMGFAGPPVAVFWLGGQADAARARDNIMALFGVTGTVSLAVYVWNGLLTPVVFLFALALAPVYAAGLHLGGRAFKRLPERTFRALSYALIGAVAAATLVVALLP
ncbi:MAG: sulfite exporter TauE/SafE family protein [Rhodospirillales bacterium]|nr:MAG: sulfite exporter TauE/SafE family protein [Rhodospirillales bacterium]